MKVFLDIGAHTGETLRQVLDPRWAFDRIVCFEPASPCWPALERLADNRVELCRFGLSNSDGSATLFNPGGIGASLSADKDAVVDSAEVELRDAAAWVRDNIAFGDQVYAKINVEGAEADIIDRLAGAGLLGRIDHLLIHFDSRKVPSLQHLEAETKRHLDAAGVEYVAAEDIQFGIPARGTANWLRWVEGDPRTRDFHYKTLTGWQYAVRRALYPIKQRVLGRP